MVHFSLEQLSVLMELLMTVPLEVGVWHLADVLETRV